MALELPAATATDAELARFADSAFKRAAWDELIRAADGVPVTAAGDRGRFFDAVCFALGQRKRFAEALALSRQLQAQPNRMRDVSYAYLHYQPLLSRAAVPGETPESLERGFLDVSARVLRDDPEHLTTLYRLGNFFAEVKSARDKKALEVFTRAISIYEGMEPQLRARRHTLFKPYVKCLYGAARSALRLGRTAAAQRFIGRCLRVDEASNHVAPVFKLYLAACALLDDGQPQRAEKGLRLALSADGPRDRAFVHARLARALEAQGDAAGAIAWLDQHVPVHRRPCWVWTQAGDLYLALGRRAQARQAWESALKGNKAGKHLVLRRLGELALDDGRHAEARRHFSDALTWLRKRHQTEDARLLEGLLRCARAANDTEAEARLTAQVERARRLRPAPGDAHAVA